MEKLTDNISPKVFISYSHDSGEHKDWVLKLATDLQHHGVNVILDQWDVRLGDDLPFFMEQGLSSSNLVLCICSDAYTEKANANKSGVGYEKKIITADLMTKSSANYIIPIKRNNKIDKIPTFFGATLYIDFNDDGKYFDNYRTLLARIYNEDIKLKPALGNNPFKTKELSSKISLGLSLGTVNFQDPALSGKVSFDYSKNDGDFLIGNGEYAFTTHWSTAGMGCIYCYRDKVRRIGYNPSFKDFPSRDSITKFDFSSRCRTINEGQIVILENQNNKFAAIKVTKIFKNVNDFGHLLNFEYQIYRDF